MYRVVFQAAAAALAFGGDRRDADILGTNQPVSSRSPVVRLPAEFLFHYQESGPDLPGAAPASGRARMLLRRAG
jgi:hypothetical protein